MITDAIIWLGVTVLDLLTGWLPVMTLGNTSELTAWAANAGSLIGCFIDVPFLGAAVGIIITVESAMLVFSLGVWGWRIIRG